MNNDYFYILGLLFLPVLVIEIFSSKKTIIKESAELAHYSDNPFEILNFIKRKGAKIIIGTLYYFWILYGLLASDLRYWFASLLLLYLISTIIFIRRKKKGHFIDVALSAVGILLLCFIIYKHFYLMHYE